MLLIVQKCMNKNTFENGNKPEVEGVFRSSGRIKTRLANWSAIEFGALGINRVTTPRIRISSRTPKDDDYSILVLMNRKGLKWLENPVDGGTVSLAPSTGSFFVFLNCIDYCNYFCSHPNCFISEFKLSNNK